MALGSKESNERRRKRREQERIAFDKAYLAVKQSFGPALEKHALTVGAWEAQRLLDKLILYESQAFQMKDPPELFAANIQRIIDGQEPLPQEAPPPPEPFQFEFEKRRPLLDSGGADRWGSRVGMRRLGRRHPRPKKPRTPRGPLR